MSTKHKVDCNMAFGRKDPTCPRCQELTNGAKPRDSWHQKRQDNNRRVMEIRNHNCRQSGCGPVCTFGDW